MDALEDRYTSFVRKLMSIIGVWPTQSYTERVIRICILGFMLFSLILLQLSELFMLDFELRSVVFLLQLLIPDMCFIVQYIMTISYSASVKKMYFYVLKDLKQVQDDCEFINILVKQSDYNTLFAVTCGLLIFCFYSLVSLPPIMRKMFTAEGTTIDYSADRFPIFSILKYFVDINQFYYTIALQEILMLVAACLIGVACYSSYFMVVQHLCGRLSIIKGQIRRPFIENESKKNAVVEPMDLSHWMIGIVRDLSQITKFVKLVNTIGRTNYFIQMTLVFLLVIVEFLCLFQIPVLLDNTETRKDVYMLVFSIAASFLPIFISCHIGQMLINHSEDVIKEVCTIPLHELSLKTQKLLLVALTMNTKPFTLVVGKFFVSSHEFFTDLLRTSLSFAMVLRSMENEW